MDRRSRASSAAKSLLGRQLASIADTLARASKRRDEEVGRARGLARTAAGTAETASLENKVPVRGEDCGRGRSTPIAVDLRGGGDDGEESDESCTPHLEQGEKAEAVRQERKDFDKMVKGKGPDDPEREKMIEFLLAHSNLAKMNAKEEIIRARLEAEEEKVNGHERMIIREKEVDELREPMLKGEEDMEREDEEARLRQWEEERRESLHVRAKNWARSMRSEFPMKTNYAALFKDPEAETAELARLEEELLEYLKNQMEAEDAKLLEDTTTSKGPEDANEGNERVKPAESPGDSAMALSLDEQEDEHSVPAIPQRRGGDENDHNAEHDQKPLATSKESEEAQQEATALATAAEEERRKKLRDDYKQMKHRVKACDIAREARVGRLQRRILREKAGRTSGLASDEAFEHMRASAETEDCEWVEAMKQQRLEAFPIDAYSADGADGTEEAMLEKSAEEELRRRKPKSEAERSYLLSPASPPKTTPPRYTESEFVSEDVGDDSSQSDTEMRGRMRGGHATPLDDNPGALLAKLASLRETIHLPEAEFNDTVYDGDDPSQMLAELDGPARSTHATATASDDPRTLLEELLALSAPGPQELRSPTSEDFEEDDDDDIDALRARLERLRTSFGRDVTPIPASVGLDESRAESTIPHDLPSEAVPYAVALELELSGCEWAVVQGWTQCLFSSGLNSYEAQQDKEIAVAHAEEALQEIVGTVLEAEEEHQRKDEQTKLERRLIVSNLAAGADVEEMERQFWQYRYDMYVWIHVFLQRHTNRAASISPYSRIEIH